MKIKYESILFKLPYLRKFSAIVLGRYMFTYYSKHTLPYEIYYHETVHQEQMSRDGVVKFYFKYIFDFVKLLFTSKFDFTWAYYHIPYEEEAYYLTDLRMFALRIQDSYLEAQVTGVSREQ